MQKISFPDNWENLYAAWDNGEITAKEFMDKSGLKKGTFYHLVNEYKELLDRMISLGQKRDRDRKNLTFTYDTNILEKGAFGAKGAKK